MSVYRFLGLPNASTDVQGIQLKGIFAAKGSLVELTPDQEREAVSLNFEEVDEAELDDDEKASITRSSATQDEEPVVQQAKPSAPPAPLHGAGPHTVGGES